VQSTIDICRKVSKGNDRRCSAPLIFVEKLVTVATIGAEHP